MRVSYKWLKSLVDIEDIDFNVLCRTITEAGLEVEGVSRLAEASSLVIGEVEECENHPDSDHLHVCKVNVGKEVRQIVCGAPNCRKGLKVIVANEGCELPAIGVTIKQSKIRGVESNGMLCSLAELGVEDKYLSEEEKAGIHELPANAPVGETKVLEYLGLDDIGLEIALTPNRGDCQSVYNLAKDIGAIMNRKMKVNLGKVEKIGGPKSSLTVTSSTPKCDLFLVRKIKGVKTGPSPKWLADILVGCGLRPINNIVDISNYMMLLYGQPMHMYDASKIAGNNYDLVDDKAEKVITLDGNEIEIKKNDLVVTAGGKSACLAGVMGLESTMIDDNTKDIVLEVASFDGVSIRKTATRLQLFSDSSARYIKGLDKANFDNVMNEATRLVKELASPDLIEDYARYDAVKKEDKVVAITADDVNKVLGTSFDDKVIGNCFDRLGFAYSKEGKAFKVSIPSYRNDIAIKEDLIEEIIRLEGYECLNSTLPNDMDAVGSLTPRQAERHKIREFLNSLGLDEVLTYTLTDEDHMPYFDVFSTKDEPIKLMSSLGKEREFLRKSILPSLCATVSYNQARQTKDVSIFEISNIYTQGKEYERLAFALSNKLNKSVWLKPADSDFYTGKGILDSLFASLGITQNRVAYTPLSDNPYYHPYRSALVYVDKKLVGVIGEIHPALAKEYKIDPTVLGEIDLDLLLGVKTGETKYKKLPLFPSVSRDIAMVVKMEVPVEEIVRLIKKTGKELVAEVTPFDEYKGEHIAKGYKSLALSITYLDTNKTLTDNEVNEVHRKVVEALVLGLNVTIR